MRNLLYLVGTLINCSFFLVLSSCATQVQSTNPNSPTRYAGNRFDVDYSSRLPKFFDTGGKKTVVVDPNVHAWGAYAANGELIRAGIATAGGAECPPDADKAHCYTGMGTYHITGLGDESCYSRKYQNGLMPYCMYFNNGEALHGSPDDIVVEDNVSHGCVRMRIPDAEWMRYHFAQIGTKVVVMPYQ
ncbi:MAG TPA: L,D-transpeptidase [Gammaproteobacteria bacterium]|nr:L,D-transpeptidase [Gammaproteobacteria bacterium]